MDDILKNLAPFDYDNNLGIVKDTHGIIEILEDMAGRIGDPYLD